MRYRALTAALCLAGAGFWLAATAMAEPGRSGRGDRLSRMLERHPEADTDGDGVLSKEEARAFFKNNPPPRDGLGEGPRGGHRWKGGPERLLETNPEADTDGDGKLSPDEHRVFMDAKRTEITKELLAAHPELDTDGDGTLSIEERKAGREIIEPFVRDKMSAKILAMHPEADTDGDGKLSEEEFAAIRRGGPGFGPGRPAPSPGMMMQWLIDNFDKVDANGDGQLSKDELTKFRDSMPMFGPGDKKGLGAYKRHHGGEKDGDKGKGEGRGRKHGKGRPADTDQDTDGDAESK